MADARQIGGNPSSVHQFGRAARRVLHTAQEHLKRLVGADAATTDVIFCGNLDEARSLSILGIAAAQRALSKRASVVLDESLWAACPGLIQQLCLAGFRVGQLAWPPSETELRIRRYSLGANAWDHGDAPIGPDDLAVLAVSALSAHGQTPPWEVISAFAQQHGAQLVVDAAVGAGRVKLDMQAQHVAACCVASAPLGGPPGLTAVALRKGVEVQALWQGGGQNLGRRSGTEATVLAAGMGEAARQAHAQLACEQHRLAALREALCVGFDGLVLPADCPDLVLWPKAAAFVTGCVGLFDSEGVMVGWTPGLPGDTGAFIRLTMGHNTSAEEIKRARTVLHKLLIQHKEDGCA